MDLKLDKGSKIYVAGHQGLVGSAVVRALQANQFNNLLTRTRQELDLCDQSGVQELFKREKPEFVVLSAAKVGGIGANLENPVDFLEQNLMIQLNVIRAAFHAQVKRLVFLGSSCIYPKEATYPLSEDQLLSGPYEPTNEAYSLAKTVGVKQCQYYQSQYGSCFVSLMPTNLYGPNDYYDVNKSHVIPAMFLKVLKAKKNKANQVTFWGSGKPLREFLHSDDLAGAVLIALDRYEGPEILNVGSGEEVTVRELAGLIQEISGFEGEIVWDQSKPDGMHRKTLSSEKIRALGWEPKRSLRQGLTQVWEEISQNEDELIKRSRIR